MIPTSLALFALMLTAATFDFLSLCELLTVLFAGNLRYAYVAVDKIASSQGLEMLTSSALALPAMIPTSLALPALMLTAATFDFLSLCELSTVLF
jgi:hypothetical protein